MLGNLNYLSLTGETLGPKRVWVQSTTKHPACGGGTYPSNSPTPQGVGTHKLPRWVIATWREIRTMRQGWWVSNSLFSATAIYTGPYTGPHQPPPRIRGQVTNQHPVKVLVGRVCRAIRQYGSYVQHRAALVITFYPTCGQNQFWRSWVRYCCC